ncbi:MAG: general L-amino acid transport system permease protein [Halocynthiibacter sp.]|jgi:general L-amino acid transport system permease protein
MNTSNTSDISFVREEILEQQAPPSTQIGIIKWARENLFSGWFNTILTLISLYVIYYVFSHIGPWFLNSIWHADSLTECREIRDALNDGEPSACFGVIKDRWHQLTYGFYPQELYWRANLAAVLLLVAIAPILFDALPRKLMIFSALYPFLLYWLVWGGTVWVPLMVIAGFFIGYLAYGVFEKIGGTLLGVIMSALVPVVWWIFAAGAAASALESIIPLSIQSVQSKDIGGFMISVIIGVSGIVLSLPLGIILALGRQSHLPVVKAICVGFIEFIRGVPLITLLFTASLLLNYFLPKGTNFDIILRVIIMVTLFSAAYMAEVIRGGLAALPRGQYEAADALGLDYWKAQRLIIMPQALKISIPGIVNTFIGLFKDTTLVVFIGIFDMIGFTGAIRATTDWNGIYWELFIFVGVVFWIVCFSMSRYSQYLEQKLRTDHR